MCCNVQVIKMLMHKTEFVFIRYYPSVVVLLWLLRAAFCKAARLFTDRDVSNIPAGLPNMDASIVKWSD